MRLLAHNLLQCNVKKCPTRFPLSFRNCTSVEQLETEFSADFMKRLLDRIDYPALLQSLSQLGRDVSTFPGALPEADSVDEATLKGLHDILMETDVVEGEMVCSGCQHVYKITDGIPCMLLNEDEV